MSYIRHGYQDLKKGIHNTRRQNKKAIQANEKLFFNKNEKKNLPSEN